MNKDKVLQYKAFIKENLPEWRDLRDDEINIEKLSSLSNQVYKATALKEGLRRNPIIFRRFAIKEGVVDRLKEHKVFIELARRNCGPHCYGGNNKYRLEEYFPARTIKNLEYNQVNIRRKLARVLATLHKIDIPNIEKIPLFEKSFSDPKFYQTFEEKCNQNIFSEDERKWIEQIRLLSHPEEKQFIRDILPTDDIVFSHNDLLQGNILIREDNQDIILIDYEYSAYNFRAYDIGNMFKESTWEYGHPEPPTFKVVDSHFPNDEDLRDFIRYYLAFSSMTDEEQRELGDRLLENEEEMKEYLEKFDEDELNERVAKLLKETKIAVMLSYYYWAIWGIKMSKNPDSDFDYFAFAKTHFEYYQKMKKVVQTHT